MPHKIAHTFGMQTDITNNWLENLNANTVEKVIRREITHAQKLKHFKFCLLGYVHGPDNWLMFDSSTIR